MRTARTMKTVTIAGVVASLALAGVAYRMNGGGETVWCLVGFGLAGRGESRARPASSPS
jgi:hypothetical protein